jgi:hypothetical protein
MQIETDPNKWLKFAFWSPRALLPRPLAYLCFIMCFYKLLYVVDLINT